MWSKIIDPHISCR